MSDAPAAFGADPAKALTALRLGGGTYMFGAQTFDINLADGPSGPGGITFAPNAPGGAALELKGVLTHTGPTIVEGAGNRLTLLAATASRNLIARNGAVFAFGGGPGSVIDVTGKQLFTDSGGRFDYDGRTLRNGTLRGTGHAANASGVTLDGTRVAPNARLVSAGTLSLLNATVAGHVVADAALWSDRAARSRPDSRRGCRNRAMRS